MARTSTRSLNPDLIIKSFNTWAFKREQPGNPERLVPAVEAAMQAGRPLEFVLYWGKGPRAEIAAPDLACLDYLGQLAERVRQAYAPGAVFRLIFTDTHAALNGHRRRRRMPISAPSMPRRKPAASPAPAQRRRRLRPRRSGRTPRGGALRRDPGEPDRLRGQVVSRRGLHRAGRPRLPPHEHGREARRGGGLPRGGVRHLQRQRVPRPVPGDHADLLHVLPAPRRRGEALVHRPEPDSGPAADPPARRHAMQRQAPSRASAEAARPPTTSPAASR